MHSRVLVTGASGFIGRATCAALTARGFEVHGTTRRVRPDDRLTWHTLDVLRDPAARLLAELKPDVVLHLAWIAPPASYRDHPDNERWADATLRLAQDAQKTGVTRQVFAGTSLEWAPDFTRYGAAKRRLHGAIEDALDPSSWAWARPYLVYGPGEAADRLIPTVARALLDGDPVALGPGDAVRDFIHVDDVAEALVVLCEGDHTGPIDLGTGRAVRVAEAVQMMARLAARPDLLRIGALPARPEPQRLVANARPLQRLGAEPRIPLEVGLAEALKLRQSSRSAA